MYTNIYSDSVSCPPYKTGSSSPFCTLLPFIIKIVREVETCSMYEGASEKWINFLKKVPVRMDCKRKYKGMTGTHLKMVGYLTVSINSMK